MSECYSVTYSDSLSHFGIKGMKWGIRKERDRKGRRVSAWKTDNPKALSMNPFVGRVINASYKDRVARGKKLRSQGRTRAGAVGRYLVRNTLVNTGASVAARLLGKAINVDSAMNPLNPAVVVGAGIVSTALTVAMTYYNVSDLIRTYQDISDINAYEDSKKR